MTTRHVAVVVSLVAFAVVSYADTRVSRADADRFTRKVDDIVRFSLTPTAGPRSTPVTESELNAYLSLDAVRDLPAGVTEPAISLVGDNVVSGRAVVDLDAVRRARVQTRGSDWLDPAQYLTGRVPVTARGAIDARNGWARLDLQSAEVGGIPIPKALLQEIVSYYSRSPEMPEGVNLDAPFQLPARIQEIRVATRQVFVVQK